MIVGTAGHIDHGKSSLVRALTGVDTDRLKQEKARGITIELGFAYLKRSNGSTIGFIDVPGHERLVHTMLAGASGIDLALLVVAADDGVMPQTREHMAIVDLLGIGRGIVALTKCDLVDEERRRAVADDIRSLLDATALASSDIVTVSAVTGEGIAELRSRLDASADLVHGRSTSSRFRLAVDRSFSMDGAGTVVTGTVHAGQVRVGDRVIVSPAGIEARVRSIHAQNAAAKEGFAGQRCALALVGPHVSTDAIVRGDVVLDPTLHAPTRRIDVRLRLLPSERKKIGSWASVKFHCGSLERDARVMSLRSAGAIEPGSADYAQIQFDVPAALAAGDRFVLRDAAASRTIAGGTVLDLRAPERHRTIPERRAELDALAQPDCLAALTALLSCDSGYVDLSAFFRDRSEAIATMEEAITTLDLVTLRTAGAIAGFLPDRWQLFVDSALARLAAHHEQSPDQPGLGQERLRLALKPRLSQPLFARALQAIVERGDVVLDRSWVRLPSHEVRLTPEEEQIWLKIKPLFSADRRFRPPRVRDVAKERSIDEAFVRRLLKLAARRGDVEEIAQDHFFLYDTVIEMADIARALAGVAADGQFAVVAFRDRLDNGRKVAIQILEFFDRQGLTMRRGDIRRINPHKADIFTRPVSAQVTDNGNRNPATLSTVMGGAGADDRQSVLAGIEVRALGRTSTGDR